MSPRHLPAGAAAALGLLALLLGVAPAPATAAEGGAGAARGDAREGEGTPGWAVRLDTYAWASGLSGRVRTLPPLPAARVDLGAGEVLGNLDGALMLSTEAVRGRLVLLGDTFYARISPRQSFALDGVPGSARLGSSTFSAMLAGGYRLVDRPGVRLDALAGLRVFALSNELRVQLGPLPAASLARSAAWVDPLVGAQLQVALTERLSLRTVAVVGGFGAGSRLMWDAYAGLAWRLDERASLFAGYRALSVDYRHDGYLYDTVQHGMLAGVSFRL
ncbi:hypothetical protein [Roseicella aquatilis]|uniref:Outer membrane protein beta-barrel domain-containing protein n=1 Tax=Roseicella aquatilis TaxID=2527868 RepID=A0A4R4D5B4_9PROT|nr:hypothetical protein [Roseicella aquatilis]TCZ54226.1 hypothetical protein EXY23_23615 [Roseicella aquatilis]